MHITFLLYFSNWRELCTINNIWNVFAYYLVVFAYFKNLWIIYSSSSSCFSIMCIVGSNKSDYVSLVLELLASSQSQFGRLQRYKKESACEIHPSVCTLQRNQSYYSIKFTVIAVVAVLKLKVMTFGSNVTNELSLVNISAPSSAKTKTHSILLTLLLATSIQPVLYIIDT